jgi:hypothetical protein
MRKRDAAAVHLLHLVSRIALRTLRPLPAERVVQRVARLMPLLPSREAAKCGMSVLQHEGTCLSRALTISAMVPGSRVVIGARKPAPDSFQAHAWVEVDGAPCDAGGAGEFHPIAPLRSGSSPEFCSTR